MARMLNASLSSALRPALPRLLAGTAVSTVSALCMLAALWYVVRLVGDPVLAALGFWLAGAALSAGEAWLSHTAEARFSASLRRQAAGHLLRLPASTLARQGDVALRRLVSEDIAALHHMVAHLPSEVAVFVVVPLTSIVLLVTLARPAALWVLLPGALSALYQIVWAPRMAKRFGAHRMETMNEMVAAVDDYARGIRVHRLYGTQSGALASYHAVTQRFTRQMDAWVAQVGTPAAIAIALLQAVATFAIAYAVVWQADASALAAVLLFSLAIVTPVLRLGHGLDYVVAGRVAAARLSAFLRAPELPVGHAVLPNPLSADQAILEIRDAALKLDGKQILNGLSHRFAPGTLTAITGASGSGKTSLLRALSGWEPLSGGAVALAGVNLAQLDAQARHQAILLVPQGGDVLQATVRENLTLRAPEATDEQLRAALREAQFAVDLDANAAALSGGEKQRVGLARAFLTASPVVLLDEPTSALDSENAMRLMNALHALAQTQGKTVVLVTHDPALAARADARLELTRSITPEALA